MSPAELCCRAPDKTQQELTYKLIHIDPFTLHLHRYTLHDTKQLQDTHTGHPVGLLLFTVHLWVGKKQYSHMAMLIQIKKN